MKNALTKIKEIVGNKKVLIIAFLAFIFSVVVFIYFSSLLQKEVKPPSDSNQSTGDSKSSNQMQKAQPSENKIKGDEFEKYAQEISGPVKIKIRDYGETVRSCIGKDCGELKDSCVRWNKDKDQCYEMIKTSSTASDKYKVYCNLVLVNQDQKSANASVNLNYITADSIEHLVKKEILNLKSGNGHSIRWDYDIDEKDVGRCGYSDLVVQERK